jgi:hypothetical protein
MIDELRDLFLRVAVTPHNLYKTFWENAVVDMTIFHKVCPMDISQEALALMKWECAHLGVNIVTSHIQVLQSSKEFIAMQQQFQYYIEYRMLVWA